KMALLWRQLAVTRKQLGQLARLTLAQQASDRGLAVLSTMVGDRFETFGPERLFLPRICRQHDLMPRVVPVETRPIDGKPSEVQLSQTLQHGRPVLLPAPQAGQPRRPTRPSTLATECR